MPLKKPLLSFILLSGLCMTFSANSAEPAPDNHPEMSPASPAAFTDTLKHGEQAHNTHCYKCHTDAVYTREDRFVKSIDALSKQVDQCKNSNSVPWFDQDKEAVVQFLNQKYYRF